MKRVYNPNDKERVIWWGHTPFEIPPKKSIVVEEYMAIVLTKHKHYNDLVVLDMDAADPGNGESPASNPEPWVEKTWDAMSAPLDEVKLYATKHNLKVDLTDEDNLRMIADEHFLGEL